MAGGGSTGTPPSYYWEASDPLGTGMVLVDESGNRVRHQVFTPFGGMHAETGANFRTFYAGHRRDEDSGMYYMQARWYDPGSGRFLSTDPMIRTTLVPQSVNPYSYAENNPVNGVDPTGTTMYIVRSHNSDGSSSTMMTEDYGEVQGMSTVAVNMGGSVTLNGMTLAEGDLSGSGETSLGAGKGDSGRISGMQNNNGSPPESKQDPINAAGVQGAEMLVDSVVKSGEKGYDIRERSVGGTPGNLRDPVADPSGNRHRAPGPRPGDTIHVHFHNQTMEPGASLDHSSQTGFSGRDGPGADAPLMRSNPGVHYFLITPNGSLIRSDSIQVVPGGPVRLTTEKIVRPAGTYVLPK